MPARPEGEAADPAVAKARVWIFYREPDERRSIRWTWTSRRRGPTSSSAPAACSRTGLGGVWTCRRRSVSTCAPNGGRARRPITASEAAPSRSPRTAASLRISTARRKSKGRAAASERVVADPFTPVGPVTAGGIYAEPT